MEDLENLSFPGQFYFGKTSQNILRIRINFQKINS